MATRAKKPTVTVTFDMSDEDDKQFHKLLEQAAYNLNTNMEELVRMSARRGFPDARAAAKARYDAIKNLNDMTREGLPPLVDLEGAMPVPGQPAPARSAAAPAEAKTQPAAAGETPAPAAAQPAAAAAPKGEAREGTGSERALQPLSSAAQIILECQREGICIHCRTPFPKGSKIIHDAGERPGQGKTRIWGADCCGVGRGLEEELDLAAGDN